MRLVVGSDHAGVALREAIVAHLVAGGHEARAMGPATGESVDYPDIAHAACDELLADRVDRVVLVCGTGQGMAMSANKRSGVRAAVVADAFSAAMAMQHNDARVLCLGERVVGVGVALSAIDAWVGAHFEGGRHARRVGKVEPIG